MRTFEEMKSIITDMSTPLREQFTHESKQYKITGLKPITSEETRKTSSTLGDYFFLEPPQTLQDVANRIEWLKLKDVLFRIDEVTVIN